MKLALLGINFKTAPLVVRERLSFTATRIPNLLAAIGKRLPGCECVLLSTCNRTELYVGGSETPSDEVLMQALLAGVQDLTPATLSPVAYSKRDAAVAEHLCAVAASLDSMVVGETEILGQVKQAYALATDQGTVGPVLHPLFQAALRVAKQVHAETDISRGRVSVSSLAVEFTERIFDDLASKTVMIVGAGETAELALRSLVERGVRDVLVLNRSPERAVDLAAPYAGRAIPFELLADYLLRADLVIASTSAPQPLVLASDTRRAMADRRGRPMLLIDLSMPRNIEPEVASIENVYLYHMDDLQRVAAENLASRGDSVARAWEIVRANAANLMPAPETVNLRRLLQAFDVQATEMRDEAVRRCLARPAVAGLPDEAKSEVAEMADKLVRKMLAQPREALKVAANNGHWDEFARVARALFHLDRGKKGPS
ncbi:MAG: glutamyl-tRNA reductase [Verrucomicrobia bacterium]|nr:glutamyl-tRNA reductase [Verrucomicrobiota bacterium]